MSVTMLLAGVGPAAEASEAQSNDTLLASGVTMIIQGTNDVIPGTESNNDFYALKILSYNLPYDVARVYTRVPSLAQDFVVWTSTGEINSTGFGIEMSGASAGDFFVDVPSSHPRIAYTVNISDDESEFNATGSEFLNTTYSSGLLRLLAGYDTGEYASPLMMPPGAHLVTSANLSYVANSSSNITSFVSNDGGSNWTNCPSNTLVDFTTSGTSLRVKFAFEGNVSTGYEPSVSSFSVNATYVLNSTVFIVHISYVWTADFTSGKTGLDCSEATDLASGGSYLLMVYLVPGYTIESSGLPLTFDEEGAMSSYPEKDLYYNLTSSTDQPSSFAIEIAAPPERSTALYYVGAAALVIALGLAYMLSTRRKSSGKTVAIKESLASETPRSDGSSPEDDESRRKELVSRKKDMLAEIETITAKMSSGEMTKKEGAAELTRMRKEFKVVRNELNRLPKKQVPPISDSSIQPSGGAESGYEPLLAALARIDDDFEKGRLPESTYKSLRKEYVSKAARALEADRSKGVSKETEKKKLMEAIVVLDEERDRGEIDEKVYAELRASYRKQLIELMKGSDRGSP